MEHGHVMSSILVEFKAFGTDFQPTLSDLFLESNHTLNTLLPSPVAWPYSASENPLTTHNSGNYPCLASKIYIFLLIVFLYSLMLSVVSIIILFTTLSFHATNKTIIIRLKWTKLRFVTNRLQYTNYGN